MSYFSPNAPSAYTDSYAYNDGYGHYHTTIQDANAANAYYTPYDSTGGYQPPPTPAPAYHYPSNPAYDVVHNAQYGGYAEEQLGNPAAVNDFSIDDWDRGVWKVIGRGQKYRLDRNYTEAPWEKQEADSTCIKCKKLFKEEFRKKTTAHHCRGCGHLVCGRCSKFGNWNSANHIQRWKSVSSATAALVRRVRFCKICNP